MRGIRTFSLALVIWATGAAAQTPPAENPGVQSAATAPFDRAAAVRRRASSRATGSENDNWYPYGGPPARFARTGSPVDAPFPGADIVLAATPVTLHLTDAPFAQAIATLGQQGRCLIQLDPNSYPRTGPRVTMDANAQPFLECLLELATSSGKTVSDFSTRHILLAGSMPGKSVGIWCTSGAFAFVLQNIQHRVPLDGQPPTFQMTLSYLAEPKVNILAAPAKLEAVTLHDELGHTISVEPVIKQVPQGLPSNFRTGHERELVLRLVDRPDCGKRIALLQASAPFTVVMRTEEISVDHPLTADAISKVSGGIRTTIARMIAGPNEYSTTITFEQASMTDEDWGRIVPLLQAARPQVRDAQGRSLQDWGNPGEAKGGHVCVQCAFPRIGGEDQSPAAPASLRLVVPVEIKTVAVPIEFKDILLP
jgi:hypothetical protein